MFRSVRDKSADGDPVREDTAQQQKSSTAREITQRQQTAARYTSQPIPISASAAHNRKISPSFSHDDSHLLSQSCPPRAPIIGSLPAPRMERSPMPDLCLPPPKEERETDFVGGRSLTQSEAAGAGSIWKFATSCPPDISYIPNQSPAKHHPRDYESIQDVSSSQNASELSTSLTALSVLRGSLNQRQFLQTQAAENQFGQLSLSSSRLNDVTEEDSDTLEETPLSRRQLARGRVYSIEEASKTADRLSPMEPNEITAESSMFDFEDHDAVLE